MSVNTVVDLDRSYTDSTDYALEPWAQGKDDGIIGTQVWDDSIVRDDGQPPAAWPGRSPTQISTPMWKTRSSPTARNRPSRPPGRQAVWWIPPSSRIEHVADISRCHGIRDHQPVCCRRCLYGRPIQPCGTAAGISAADQQEKISILVSPFYTEQSSILPTTGVSPWVLYAGAGRRDRIFAGTAGPCC